MSVEHTSQEPKPSKSEQVKRHVDNFGPTFAMIVIIGFVFFVVSLIFFPRDQATIMVGSQGGAADFNATSALAYADRVSRIAELTVGGVLTLALGLVGFSWLSTSARIERDRQELAEHKENLDKQLNERLERQGGDFDTKIASLSTELTKTRTDLRNETSEKFSRLLQSQLQEQSTLSQIRNEMVHSKFVKEPLQTVQQIQHQLRNHRYDEAFEDLVIHLSVVTQDTNRRLIYRSWLFESSGTHFETKDQPISAMIGLLPLEMLEEISRNVPRISRGLLGEYVEEISKSRREIVGLLEHNRDQIKSSQAHRLIGIFNQLQDLENLIRERLAQSG